MESSANPSSKLVRRLSLVLAAIAVGALGWVLLGEGDSLRAAESGKPAAGAGSPVVATFGDEKITEAEVAKRAANELRALDRQRHEILQANVRNELNDRLVATEAKARGLSAQDLLAIEVDAKVGDITDADIDAFYAQRQSQIRQPKEQVADQIRQYLRQQQQQQRYQAFITSLETKYGAVITLEPWRAEVAANGPSKGPSNAPVTIVEFSDFECPFCGKVGPTLQQVLDKYGDKVRLVFRQFPLNFHAHAQKAGEASLCAHEQGQFWAMHDLMFGDQKALAVEQLKAKAATIKGLDTAAFAQCLDGGQTAATIRTDLAEGSAAGVSGTPAFFINGRFLSGAMPFEQFAQVIDEELARASKKG